MATALEVVYEYYRVFSTLDLSAIVEYFSEPCMSIGPQGVFSARSREELAGALGPMVESLRARGYGRSEFADAEMRMLGESAALVRGTAVRYSASGPVMERVPISYVVHRSGAGWLIAVMVIPG